MEIWDRIFEKNPNIVYRIIAGEAILVPVAQRPDELGCIFSLNETAARIWEFLDGKKSLLKVKQAVLEEFDVPEEILAKDMLALVKLFERSSLIN